VKCGAALGIVDHLRRRFARASSWALTFWRPLSKRFNLLLQARDLVCKSGELRRCFANLEEFTMHNVTRRAFGKLSTTIAAIALGLIVTLAGFAASAAESGNEARPAQDDKLQSEFLLDLTLEAQTPQNLGSAGGGRLISGGTFAGPRLKGTIIPPGGDWIASPGGTLNARILPVFETAAAKYAWLNNVVAVGVYRPDLGKIAYRIYRIL